MSSEQPTSAAPPPADHGNGNGGPDFSSDAFHEAGAANAAGAADLSLGTAELANLLANGQWAGSDHGLNSDATDTNGYDAHVALALDTGVLPDIDSTLDLLTSSHHLFDVPALDVSSTPDDASSA
jgi:hypothetical protein